MITLHSGEGGVPVSGLSQGGNGNFYGTTSADGVNNDGTIFKLTAHPAFFTGEVALADSVYYLTFPGGNLFGYYSFQADPNYLYHFDLGYEHVFNAGDINTGVHLYAFASNDFFYTSPTFPTHICIISA